MSTRREEGGGSGGNRGSARATGFPRADRVVGRLNAPRPALVEPGFDGAPRAVDRETVALVRRKRVVDRWWTEEPVDRRYFEVVLESGRNVCVYRDQDAGCWFAQNA